MADLSNESLNDFCSPLLESDGSEASSDEQEDKGGNGVFISRVLFPEFDGIDGEPEWVYNDITNSFEAPSDAVYLIAYPSH